MAEDDVAATEQEDKFHRVYTILVLEEIQAWLDSEGGIPSANVTTAFREAEQELLKDENDDPMDGSTRETP